MKKMLLAPPSPLRRGRLGGRGSFNICPKPHNAETVAQWKEGLALASGFRL
jgi:hypothetical protein